MNNLEDFKSWLSVQSNMGMAHINGDWINGSGYSFESLSPVDSGIAWEGCSVSDSDIEKAISISRSAQIDWAQKSTEERINHLKKFAELLIDNTDIISSAISYEIGKPLWESKTEVSALAGKLSASIDAFNNRSADILFSAKIQGVDSKVITTFLPHGIVAVISPYNFPLHMANGHILPALIAGNSVIFKPSELGMLSAHIYMDLAKKSGLPNGLINMLPGKGDVAEKIINHSDIKAVFFTGSTDVGKSIQKRSEELNKLCALEMGGDGVIYIDDYDDMNGAIKTTIQSSFITAGQRCSTARQILISEKAKSDGFLDKLVDSIDKIDIGNPFDDEVPFYGPMRRNVDVENVLSFIEEAIDNGGKVLVSPKRHQDMENLISPCIILMPSDSKWNPGELVGPVARVRIVADVNEAIDIANSIDLRLIASIVTNSEDTYKKFSDSVLYGGINLNCPTTGNSGWASFGGLGHSGNFRPSGYLASDYCVVGQSRIEKSTSSADVKVPGFDEDK